MGKHITGRRLQNNLQKACGLFCNKTGPLPKGNGPVETPATGAGQRIMPPRLRGTMVEPDRFQKVVVVMLRNMPVMLTKVPGMVPM